MQRTRSQFKSAPPIFACKYLENMNIMDPDFQLTGQQCLKVMNVNGESSVAANLTEEQGKVPIIELSGSLSPVL